MASAASHGQGSRDSKDHTSNVLLLAADDNLDDKSVTVTTCHNGNIGVDGAFQEEEQDDAGSGKQPVNLNAVVNLSQEKGSSTVKKARGSASDDDGQAEPHAEGHMFQEDDALKNEQLRSRRPPANAENINDDATNKPAPCRINKFDVSKVEHDSPPSDSEPPVNKQSRSNSPTQNRKPIMNSQPKTNL